MTAPQHLEVDNSVTDVAENAERLLSLVAGALLLTPIFRARSSWRWMAAAAGAALLYKGAGGAFRLGAFSLTSRLSTAKAPTPPERIVQTITIGKSAGQLFALWRDPDALAKLMAPFGQITWFGTDHLRWKIELPIGELESDAALVEARPYELVHWRSVPDSKLAIDEFMRFSPAPQGDITEVTLEYLVDFSRVPAGKTLRAVASFFKEAFRSVLREILDNFKSLAETGDIPPLQRKSKLKG